METNNTENLDSSMEEQEINDSENVEEVEETEEQESSEESEDSNEPEYTENEKQLYARAKKAEKEAKEAKAELEKNSAKNKPKKEESSTDEVTLSRLEARGILDEQDQEYVLRFAKAEGVSPIEALKDDLVKDRLKANERARKSADATPRSNNRANNEVDEVDALVRKFREAEKAGRDPAAVLPDNNPLLVSKILKKLKK